jgi:hypothetical protein
MSMMIRRGVARAAKAAPVITYVEEKPVEKSAEKPVLTDLVTKADVEKMPYFGLKSLATKNGIDTDGKKAAELKAEIIEKLNL